MFLCCPCSDYAQITFFNANGDVLAVEKIAKYDATSMHELLTSKGIKLKADQGPLDN